MAAVRAVFPVVLVALLLPAISTAADTAGKGLLELAAPNAAVSLWINEMTQNRGIPLEAALGGPATMYPEYRRKLKDTYKMPAACKSDCGTPLPLTGAGRAATQAPRGR
jgi:hypothetical protein